MWEIKTGTHLRTLTGHIGVGGSVAFSPDGNTIAMGGNNADLWEIKTGTHLRTITGHAGTVISIAFSPDGNTIATGSADKKLRLWDPLTGEHQRTLTGHTGAVFSVAFSPDGNTITSASRDDTVRLWDAKTGEHQRTLTGHTGSVNSVAFSPDGNTIASASSDDTVRLWDAKTGEHQRTLAGHRFSVFSVAFSPDGTTLASGSFHEIHLWNTKTGEHQRTLTGHTDSVYRVAFSPDGNTLASGSRDGTVLLWELTSTVGPSLVGDANHDGVVNILDLVLVGSVFGKTGQNDADINGDGIVNIVDLVTVAGVIGNTGAAARIPPQALSMLATTDVQGWLIQAQGLNLIDLQSQTGIRFLEQLLAALTPKETALLQNYPNPFNPETWIPYHLADDGDVQIAIYDTKSVLVRRLDIGNQPAGYYADRAKAAYWDGRNKTGELVASGIYFYTLTTGAYSTTRKMLILK